MRHPLFVLHSNRPRRPTPARPALARWTWQDGDTLRAVMRCDDGQLRLCEKRGERWEPGKVVGEDYRPPFKESVR